MATTNLSECVGCDFFTGTGINAVEWGNFSEEDRINCGDFVFLCGAAVGNNGYLKY